MLTRPSRRIWSRAAQRIHDHLVRRPQHDSPVFLPEAYWLDLELSARQFRLAQERGWHAAAARLRTRLDYSVAGFIRQLETCRHQIHATPRPIAVPSVHEIYRDLAALDEEFEEVHYDLKKRTLSVATDFVVLDGIELGRFQIVMPWEQGPSYKVVALDPNPAATNAGVTHPHVQAERLCEGDGHAAIGQALEQGRILDFFLLVRQVLQTYGDDSPYVSLDRWYGRDCQDCGYGMQDDESTTCERCDSEICYECSSSCHSCARCCCSQCRGRCQGCEEDCCTTCLNSCRSCEEKFCSQCLTDGQCHDCQESEDASEEPDDAAPNPAATEEAADTALHALRLGEATLPA